MKEFDSFPCKNPGCTETLSPESVGIISIMVSCYSSAPAVICPKCKRLHWPESGRPVRNRQHKAAFIDENGYLENRPILASEKKAFVQELQNNCTDDDKIIIGSILKDLVDHGHTADCPAFNSNPSGECTCGTSDAAKWIAKHPVPAIQAQ